MSRFRTIEVSDPRFESDGLREVTFKSPALGGRADVTVWAPSHTEGAAIVLLLHGVYGSHWAWARKGGAHRTAARLIESGAIPPVVLAMPSDGLWGDGSGYLAHGGRDFEAYARDEVPALVREVVPGANGKVFLAGLSMGGFGALKIAAKNPRHFAGVSGHSSVTHFSQLFQFVEEGPERYGRVPEEEQSVLYWMTQRGRGGREGGGGGGGGHLPPIRFDCGTEDLLVEHNRELHRAMTDLNIPHEYKEFPGGHEWAYWETHVEDTLRFFGRLI